MTLSQPGQKPDALPLSLPDPSEPTVALWDVLADCLDLQSINVVVTEADGRTRHLWTSDELRKGTVGADAEGAARDYGRQLGRVATDVLNAAATLLPECRASLSASMTPEQKSGRVKLEFRKAGASGGRWMPLGDFVGGDWPERVFLLSTDVRALSQAAALVVAAAARLPQGLEASLEVQTLWPGPRRDA